MPWKATVTLDADKTKVGTASATWNEGEPDEFTHSERVQVTVDEGKKFAAKAVAKRNAAVEKAEREAPLAVALTNILTAEEAKE